MAKSAVRLMEFMSLWLVEYMALGMKLSTFLFHVWSSGCEVFNQRYKHCPACLTLVRTDASALQSRVVLHQVSSEPAASYQVPVVIVK